MNTPDVLTARDVMTRLGLKKSAFYAREKAGQFQHLEITRPIGKRRYSKLLLDQFVAGESTVAFGRRRAS